MSRTDDAYLVSNRRPWTLAAFAVLALIAVGVAGAGAGKRSGSRAFQGAEVRALAIDPRDPATLYAATTGGIFKTTNGARSWRIVSQAWSRSIEVHPTAPRIVYAGGSGLLRTADGGGSWRALDGGGDQALAIAPRTPGTIYAGSDDGLAKSTDGGRTWRHLLDGYGDPVDEVFAIAVDPRNTAIVHVGADSGVLRSTNGGRTWTHTEGRAVFALEVDPLDPSTVFLGADGDGISKSTDRGQTWRFSVDSSGLDVSAFAIDPSRPTNVYAASGGFFARGVFKSVDGGTTWRAVSSGLRSAYVETLAIDSRSPAPCTQVGPRACSSRRTRAPRGGGYGGARDDGRCSSSFRSPG